MPYMNIGICIFHNKNDACDLSLDFYKINVKKTFFDK